MVINSRESSVSASSSSSSSTIAATASAIMLGSAAILAVATSTKSFRWGWKKHEKDSNSIPNDDDDDVKRKKDGRIGHDGNDDDQYAVLPCIRNRRSIFPKSYEKNPSQPVSKEVIRSLLDAALWGPFHGKCYAGHQHPAKFVILDKSRMNQMQELNLDYYDRNWPKIHGGEHFLPPTELFLNIFC